jgi:hypothetical protein
VEGARRSRRGHGVRCEGDTVSTVEQARVGTAMKCTEEQLDTLRHMLGINTPFDRVPSPYRDYAAVVVGDARFAEMERLGLVECYRRAKTEREYDYFRCTETGRAAAMASHREIRMTKAKRVYWRFLEVSDAIADLTFREFLVAPVYAEVRRDA